MSVHLYVCIDGVQSALLYQASHMGHQALQHVHTGIGRLHTSSLLTLHVNPHHLLLQSWDCQGLHAYMVLFMFTVPVFADE